MYINIHLTNALVLSIKLVKSTGFINIISVLALIVLLLPSAGYVNKPVGGCSEDFSDSRPGDSHFLLSVFLKDCPNQIQIFHNIFLRKLQLTIVRGLLDP